MKGTEHSTVPRKYEPGDVVRLSEQLETEWVQGRIAGGGAVGQLVGQISDKPVLREGEFCGTCEEASLLCDGPFYIVENIDAIGIYGDGMVFAEHELRAVADLMAYAIETGAAVPFKFGVDVSS